MAVFNLGSGLDDAVKYGSSFDNASSWVSFGWWNYSDNNAVRFVNVTIPKGYTILTAKVTGTIDYGSGTGTVRYRVWGIDEDNTSNFSSDPFARTTTTAYADWTITNPTKPATYDSPSLVNIVQEIVNRDGWSSGNAMGFFFLDNGSDQTGEYECEFYSYDQDSSKAFTLTVTYEAPATSRTSTSKASVKRNTSRTMTSKAIIYLPDSVIVSAKAFIKNPRATITAKGYIGDNVEYGIRVIKPTYDVLTDVNPSHMIFDSRFGTLKYYTSGTVTLTLDDYSTEENVAHNLGYIPYVEAYVEDGPGRWSYIPFWGYGASTMWHLVYTIDNQNINFYAESGLFLEPVDFVVKYFIFKNELFSS